MWKTYKLPEHKFIITQGFFPAIVKCIITNSYFLILNDNGYWMNIFVFFFISFYVHKISSSGYDLKWNLNAETQPLIGTGCEWTNLKRRYLYYSLKFANVILDSERSGEIIGFTMVCVCVCVCLHFLGYWTKNFILTHVSIRNHI